MAPSDDYNAIPSMGKLRLKGVKDSKIDKRKKARKPKTDSNDALGDGAKDNAVVLKSLEDEDRQIQQERRGNIHTVASEELVASAKAEDKELGQRIKTEAEKRYDEQRRKRLDERLRREGVKTHKQRVEELNRYLSGLSEHHDMPRIGPG